MKGPTDNDFDVVVSLAVDKYACCKLLFKQIQADLGDFQANPKGLKSKLKSTPSLASSIRVAVMDI